MSRALTRILKIGVKMLPSRKSWNFTIQFYWHFSKVKNSKFGVNETSGCHHIFSAIFDWILFIFAGNADMYKSLNEFEIRPDATTGFHGNR